MMKKRDVDLLRWHLRAGSSEYRKNIDSAIESIHSAQSDGKFIISWSAGKDSTAMAHLILSLYPDTPLMIQFDDCDWPEKRPYAGRVMEKQGWKNVHCVEPNFSVWERMKAGRIGEEAFCAQSHPLTQDAFLKPLAAKQHELRCKGVYMGLRAEESKARKKHLQLRGKLYRLKSGEWRCCPLAHWTAEDVYAYLTQHDIEINPCYFNNRFLPPEEIRLSWAIPTPTSIRYGDMEHLRFYYPLQLGRLREMGVS
jgi:3'-phosphoadenosine 5'-phosphosulfate sulfotransferase (PAPS reductase)/FAD synthetase